MKTKILIGALVLILAVGFSLVGTASAQSPLPGKPPNPPAPGILNPGRMGNMMRGMRTPGSFGPMHEYMQEALAEALGVTKAQLEAAIAEGKTVWQIAQEKGFSLEDFQKLMVDARKSAIGKMVEAGVITQAQADWMTSRMEFRGRSRGARGMGCPNPGSFRGFQSFPNPPSAGF